MNKDHNQRRWGVIAIAAITLLAIGPQLSFIIQHGRDWHGANAIAHTDEVAYSAYIASLIRSRPRKNDPYTGRRDTPSSPAPESLFSIQMVPAYAIAAPARVLGLSASSAFIVFPIFCAMASAFAIFWLVSLVSGDRRLAAAAVCFVLAFGTLFAGQGMIRYIATQPFLIPKWITDNVQSPSVFHLPFLRFYQPAVGFPFFFILCALAWKALTDQNNQRVIIKALFAAITFALLIFTYFFLWTAAAAWLVSMFVMWFIFRRENRRRLLLVFATIAVVAGPTLGVYFWLLSKRASTVDAAQVLVATHRPDFFRLPEIIALLIIGLLIFCFVHRRINLGDSRVLFVAATALSIIAVFNQQIITGRSLQPFHYEWFIANYLAGLALMLMPAVLSHTSGRAWLTNKRLLVLASVSFLWAVGEVWLATSLTRAYNNAIDDGRVVANRLQVLSAADGAVTATNDAHVPVVLLADLTMADRLPTDAPQAVLWAPHMLVFPGVSENENRQRFFNQLHYLGFDEKKFYSEIERGGWNFYAGLFPYERLAPVVRGEPIPITQPEIRAKIQEFTTYSNNFTREQATNPRLSYLVVRSDRDQDFTNLDRWYERDRGEVLGKFVLYKLKLRD